MVTEDGGDNKKTPSKSPGKSPARSAKKTSKETRPSRRPAKKRQRIIEANSDPEDSGMIKIEIDSTYMY